MRSLSLQSRRRSPSLSLWPVQTWRRLALIKLSRLARSLTSSPHSTRFPNCFSSHRSPVLHSLISTHAYFPSNLFPFSLPYSLTSLLPTHCLVALLNTFRRGYCVVGPIPCHNIFPHNPLTHSVAADNDDDNYTWPFIVYVALLDSCRCHRRDVGLVTVPHHVFLFRATNLSRELLKPGKFQQRTCCCDLVRLF